MTLVQDEHLVGNLDVPYAVRVDEKINFLDDALRAPEPVAVHGAVQPCRLFALLERRLNTTERAVIRAAERRVDRRVGLPLQMAEAVPVVRAVLAHGQQVPGDAGHF